MDYEKTSQNNDEVPVWAKELFNKIDNLEKDFNSHKNQSSKEIDPEFTEKHDEANEDDLNEVTNNLAGTNKVFKKNFEGSNEENLNDIVNDLI